MHLNSSSKKQSPSTKYALCCAIKDNLNTIAI
jgi:hypothetical protein